MTAEVIEGTAVEVEPVRALVVAQPGQVLVAENNGHPADIIAIATELADALKDVVERQKLYSVINGKKFPQVEAWMTIGRLDNVVAREAEPPIRNDDGSYVAYVELVRLSDGMVIGRASALCGTPDDKPWGGRSEPNRRSMAVTRATSRAFRQQYSWIMALAGYEATPADEMPDEHGETHAPSGPAEVFLGMLTKAGTIKKGDGAGYQLEARQTPDGPTFGFRFEFAEKDPETGERKAIPQVMVPTEIATPLILDVGGDPAVLFKKRATLRGALFSVSQPGRKTYYRLVVKEWHDAERTIPPVTEGKAEPVDDEDIAAAADLAFGEAPSQPLGLVPEEAA